MYLLLSATLAVFALFSALVPVLGTVLGLGAIVLAVMVLWSGGKKVVPVVIICVATVAGLSSMGTVTRPLAAVPSNTPAAASAPLPESTEPRPAPAPSVDATQVIASAQPQTALAALSLIVVSDAQDTAGYARAAFAFGAYDFDHNGCDARNDILRRDLTATTLKPGTNGCVVLSGTLNEPYSGSTISFVRGATTSSLVQIDHVVSLEDAWRSGASTWTPLQLEQFGNDPLNLLAVSGKLNDQKGDSDAAQWLPPNPAYRCTYVARQVAVKYTYNLSVDTAERAALAGVLSTCPSQQLPAGAKALPTPVTKTPEPSPVVVPPPAASAATQGGSSDSDTSSSGGAVYYKNCAAVRAAGKAPLYRGQPGYRPGLDRDHDGVACEK